MTDPRETLARIRKQADNATEGPWRHISIFEVGGFVEDSHGRELFDWAQDDAGTICAPDPDAEFIAAARTDVPALLDLADAVLDLADELTRDGNAFMSDADPVRAKAVYALAARIRTTITTALEGETR